MMTRLWFAPLERSIEADALIYPLVNVVIDRAGRVVRANGWLRRRLHSAADPHAGHAAEPKAASAPKVEAVDHSGHDMNAMTGMSEDGPVIGTAPAPAPPSDHAADAVFEPAEMARTFNCGIGMVLAVAAEDAAGVAAELTAAGEFIGGGEAQVIGQLRSLRRLVHDGVVRVTERGHRHEQTGHHLHEQQRQRREAEQQLVPDREVTELPAPVRAGGVLNRDGHRRSPPPNPWSPSR